MNNNNTDLFKILLLSEYDIDYEKSSSVILEGGSTIDLHLILLIKSRECPYCHSHKLQIKDTIIKRIYHPVMPEKNVTIILHQRKFKCPECGHITLQDNPIADSSISKLGSVYLLNSFKNPRVTFKDVSNKFHIPVTSVIRLFDEHIQLNRHQLTQIVSFDEIHLAGISKTSYACCIYSLSTNTLLDLLDSRKKLNLVDYFAHIPIKERLIVEYVTMDMWQTYKDIAIQSFPNLKGIAVDSFHVIKHINSAIDSIRRSVQLNYADKKDKDKTSTYWLLKTFHYFFKKDFNDIKYKCRPKSNFGYLIDKHAVLDKLLSINESLKEAYYLKEEYREFNLVGTYEEALIKIPEFIKRFKKSKRSEMRTVGIMMENWEKEIINSFIRVNSKRLSNGPMESENGRISKIMSDANGYSNFERFRNRVMFGLNKDEPMKF